MSENYPDPYPHGAKETWFITAFTGSIIALQFHSFYVRFTVESKVELIDIICSKNIYLISYFLFYRLNLVLILLQSMMDQMINHLKFQS